MAFARPFFVLLLIATSAFADDKSEAKKHYELGKRHFNVSEFKEAIEEFKIAYKLHPQANDLYNIAQAYRLLGDCANAAQFYASYQREEKNKKLRDSVDKVRAEMEACAAAPKPPDPPVNPKPPDPTVNTAPPPPQTYTPPPPPPGPPTGANAMRPPPGPEDPNKARRTAGIVLMVVGGMSIIGSVYWAVEADQLDKEIKLCEASDPLFPDPKCRFERFDSGRLDGDRDAAERNAKGSFGFGVVCGVGGYLLYRFSKKPAAARVTITPTRHGAALGWVF